MATPKPVTLAPINVGPEPTGVADLPEVDIEANAPIPAGQISVMSPEGQAGTMPIDVFLKEGIKEGFTLPKNNEPAITADDITPDKQIKVVRKSDGVEGTIPLDQFLANQDEAQDYEIKSRYDPEYQKKVNEDLHDLTHAGWSNIDDRHRNDDIQDKDGNYKLIDPSGGYVSVKRDQLTPLLMAGFKFQDSNFQSLYEANRKIASDTETGANVYSSNAASDVPGIGPLINKLNEKFGSNAAQASLIALDVAKEKEQKTAATLGTVSGMVAQLALPSGVFGEMKLGQAAKAGILAKLAPEGASFGRTLLAKGLAMGAEGAIISSPQAIAKLAIDQDPKAAAETLGLGFGIGAGLGVLGGVVSKGGQLALGLGEKAGERLKTGAIANVLEEAGVNNTKGLAAKEIEEGLKTGSIFERTAETDEKFAQTLREQGLKTSSKTDQVLDVSRKLVQGENLGTSLQKLDKLGSAATVGDVVAKFKESASGLLQETPELSKYFDQWTQHLEKYADKEGNLSLDSIKKFAQSLGDDVNWKKLKESLSEAGEKYYPAEELKATLWKDTAEVLGMAGDKLAEKADAKLVAEWIEKRTIQKMSDAMFNEAISSADELNPKIRKLLDMVGNKAAGYAKYGGAAIGMSVGAPVGLGAPAAAAGALIGEGFGKILNKVTGPAANYVGDTVEKWAQNSNSKISNWLLRNKTANAIGSYIAIDAVKNMESKLNEIPGFIKDIAQTAKVGAIKVPASFIGPSDPIKLILGPEANGLSKAQQFQRLSNKTAAMSSDETMKQQYLDLHIAPLFKDHPELAQQIAADHDQKLQVINQILNTGNNKQPEPFVKNKPFSPTPAQMADIENKLKVVVNPYAILDGMKNGKVTSEQVAIVAQLNPAILQKMQNEIAKQAFNGSTTLSYQQKLSASKIMGTPMAPSLRNKDALQAVYGNNQPEQVAQGETERPKKQGNSKPIKPQTVAKYSLSQRIASV